MTAKEALEIAVMHNGGQPLLEATVHDELPPNCAVYRWWKDECWHILIPPPQPQGGVYRLCSSRLIVVSRNTGRVLYDDDARDEG